MAQAQQANRTGSNIALQVGAFIIPVLIVGVMIVASALAALQAQPSNHGGGELSPALIQAGRDWELQRRQQSIPYVDPLAEAEREWERQRNALSEALE